MRIETVAGPSLGRAYRDLVRTSPAGMFTHSPWWLEMLRSVSGGEVSAVRAMRGEDLLAAMPMVVSEDRGAGRVLNSLPFFGSHGGIVASDEARDDGRVASRMLAELDRVAAERSCRSATLILSPSGAWEASCRRSWRPDFEDERIGQITPLPDTEDRLMDLYSGSRRNNVRKARKAGVEVTREETDEALAFLRDLHLEAMEAKGGTPKPPAFFDWCSSRLDASFLRIYTARIDGVRVAGALIFVFADDLEYYLPVIDLDYSAENPLVLVVHEVMEEGIREGRDRFNFGGTWTDQDGVYRFKTQFGARDHRYRYLTKLYDPELRTASRDRLREAFPHFFVIPYRELTGDSA